MSRTRRLRRSPGTFPQLPGIASDVFDGLLAERAPGAWAAEAKRLIRRPRQRMPGGGAKHTLDLSDRLRMRLLSFRTSTHAVLGFLFGRDDSNVGCNRNPLQPLLAGIFRIPERRVELAPDEIRELFFDATERPIPRPARGQQGWYSGKTKRHTLKHWCSTRDSGSPESRSSSAPNPGPLVAQSPYRRYVPAVGGSDAYRGRLR